MKQSDSNNSRRPETVLLVGIDGGATKTDVLVQQPDGHIAHGRSGPANIAISCDESWTSIETAMRQAFESVDKEFRDPGMELVVAAGIAGTEVSGASGEFLRHPKRDLFGHIELVSDGLIACIGAHEGDDGGIVSVGTGIIGYRQVDGESMRVSGWGFPYADEGSGAWVGMEAIRGALSVMDHRRSPTPYLSALGKQFDGDPFEIVAKASHATNAWFASFAPSVFDAAHDGDPFATEVVAQAIGEVEKIIAILRADSGRGVPIPIALVGGLADSLREFLSPQTRRAIVAARGDAVHGALRLARQVWSQRHDIQQ